ncbi:uncharacterized protein BROUX77_007798 [Berkeleyomyces rouxiae]|uniref:uncharacterized protein n=1 Tax=Berkeleyomyces rouxiae TaxID=2035830 RepID=UPI003B76C965
MLFSPRFSATCAYSPLRTPLSPLTTLRFASSSPRARAAAVSRTAPIDTAVAKVLAYPESRVNPPLTTLPPKLSLPDKSSASSKASYYMGMAKGYLAFYKTGLKSVFAAKNTLKNQRAVAAAANAPMASIRAVLDQFHATGTLPQTVSRADWLFQRRVRHDTLRIPLFGLILLVCGELTPLIALYIQGIMPYTCRLPAQLHKDMAAVETRRSASFARLAPALPAGLQGADGTYVPAGARALARRHVLCSLHLMPALLDRVAGDLLAPLYWRAKAVPRLRFLAVDDALLRRDGATESLAEQELKLACVERGLMVTDVPVHAMREQLRRWLTLAKTTGPEQGRADEAQKRIVTLLTTRPDKWNGMSPGFAVPDESL